MLKINAELRLALLSTRTHIDSWVCVCACVFLLACLFVGLCFVFAALNERY